MSELPWGDFGLAGLVTGSCLSFWWWRSRADQKAVAHSNDEALTAIQQANLAFIEYLTNTATKQTDHLISSLDKLTDRVEAGERRAEARHEALMGMFRQKIPTGDNWRFPEEG